MERVFYSVLDFIDLLVFYKNGI